ncbi:tetraspanin-2A [Eurytemora carolleeae]|uniref:tetraspanin-2A n=1 Tax=Eurytemora carolleeae TaxID=1294199 RepID=UPI000C76DA13|nr:tetraspanin-2A [Eurytemora carolleeae]|eukprot:XP_023343800.1 tetraspanin-2A-like [Eurytemora affinis]
MFGGYSGVRKDSLEDLERKTLNMQYTLLILGILCALIALANFSICIWIRFDLDFWEWIIEIGWYSYWNAMYVVMIGMVLTALNSALMCYSVMSESRGLMLLSVVLRLIIWCVVLAGAVVICIYGVEESDLLVRELDLIFRNLINKWDEDPRASRILRMIQEYVGCCGASGNRDDYFNVRKVIPMECRHPVTGNNYLHGCPQTLAWWLEPWTATLSALSLLFTLTDIPMIFLNLKLRSLLLQLQE